MQNPLRDAPSIGRNEFDRPVVAVFHRKSEPEHDCGVPSRQLFPARSYSQRAATLVKICGTQGSGIRTSNQSSATAGTSKQGTVHEDCTIGDQGFEA